MPLRTRHTNVPKGFSMSSTDSSGGTLPPRRSRTMGASLAASGLFFAILFVMGWLGHQASRNHLIAMADSSHADLPVVTTTTPHMSPASDIVLPGTIQAIEETVIGARTSGYIRRRYVDIGSRVKSGDLLAEIESPDVDQQVIQARAETAKSQAAAAQAQAEVARSGAGVEVARSETKRLQANVEQAQAALNRAKARAAQSRAGISGAQAKLAQSRQALLGRTADLAQARAQLSIANKSLARWKQLAQEGAVSPQEVDERQATYDASTARVSAADAAVAAARSDIEAAQEAIHASEADADASQSDVAAAEQAIQAAKAAVRTNESMVIAARAGVRASEANAGAGQAQVASSRANVQRYAALRAFERITAPFDGVITARNVDTGSLVKADTDIPATGSTTPRTGLFGLARTNTLRIQAGVPQTVMGWIHENQPAKVLVREFPGREFKGTVYRTAGALDASTRTLLTEVHLDNHDGLLKPGMYAQVAFAGQTERTLPRIPSNALMIDA